VPEEPCHSPMVIERKGQHTLLAQSSCTLPYPVRVRPVGVRRSVEAGGKHCRKTKRKQEQDQSWDQDEGREGKSHGLRPEAVSRFPCILSAFGEKGRRCEALRCDDGVKALRWRRSATCGGSSRHSLSLNFHLHESRNTNTFLVVKMRKQHRQKFFFWNERRGAMLCRVTNRSLVCTRTKSSCDASDHVTLLGPG
jgi:hypothetical protein